MSQIDPTTVDVENVIARIQAVRRGELPEDAVSVEELRAAIQAQRNRYSQSAVTTTTTPSGEKKAVVKKSGLVIPNLDNGGVGL